MSSRLTSSNLLAIIPPDDEPASPILQQRSAAHLDALDVDGVPLSPLQRIASGLPAHREIDEVGSGPIALLITEALSSVAIRLDLLGGNDASPLTHSGPASSKYTPEYARSWGPPEPTSGIGQKQLTSEAVTPPPLRRTTTPASSSFAAHTGRKSQLPHEKLLTPTVPVNIAVVATERFTSYYPSGRASEIECSRCEAMLPTTSAFCHSCGGSIVVPVMVIATAASSSARHSAPRSVF